MYTKLLCGFLLGLPFTSHFGGLHPWQRWLYIAVMMLSSVSVVLLVAPVALIVVARNRAVASQINVRQEA